jgi:hypothetical protein
MWKLRVIFGWCPHLSGDRKENYGTTGPWDYLCTRNPPHEHEAALLTTPPGRTATNVYLHTLILLQQLNAMRGTSTSVSIWNTGAAFWTPCEVNADPCTIWQSDPHCGTRAEPTSVFLKIPAKFSHAKKSTTFWRSLVLSQRILVICHLQTHPTTESTYRQRCGFSTWHRTVDDWLYTLFYYAHHTDSETVTHYKIGNVRITENSGAFA